MDTTTALDERTSKTETVATTVDVVVIDGTNLLHRCFHAMAASDLRDLDGNPIWAVSGLLGYIAKLLSAWQPNKLIVGFDLDGCPTRKALAPEYKAGRKPTDPQLAVQLGVAPEVIEAAGFSVGSVSGWEADDVCATVATKARGTVAIVSSDKDAHQLISDRVIVVKPEGVVFDDAKLFAKYGVHGHRWIEYAALVGEASDNLHGVDGIGPKRAADLVSAFSDIEEAFLDLDAVSERVGKAVAAALPAGMEAFRRNRQVATLRGDLTLGVTGRLPDADTVRNGVAPYGLVPAGARLATALTRLSR